MIFWISGTQTLCQKSYHSLLKTQPWADRWDVRDAGKNRLCKRAVEEPTHILSDLDKYHPPLVFIIPEVASKFSVWDLKSTYHGGGLSTDKLLDLLPVHSKAN